MTHPIERASVEQADREAAALLANFDISDGKRVVGSWDAIERYRITVQTLAKHRQQARDAGFAEGVDRAAAYHDARAEKWTKESCRHTRKGGYRSDCEQRDLERARQHRLFATAIRALITPIAEKR